MSVTMRTDGERPGTPAPQATLPPLTHGGHSTADNLWRLWIQQVDRLVRAMDGDEAQFDRGLDSLAMTAASLRAEKVEAVLSRARALRTPPGSATRRQVLATIRIAARLDARAA